MKKPSKKRTALFARGAWAVPGGLFVLLALPMLSAAQPVRTPQIASAPVSAPVVLPVPVVAAENVYGDIAHQIGGPDVVVTSILSNPNQDPHLFEVDPTTARKVAAARLVIFNGADYDGWMNKLLAASHPPQRQEINVGQWMQVHQGDNPHLWYDIETIRRVAGALTEQLQALAPAKAEAFAQRQGQFLQTLAPLQARITQMRAQYAGVAVTATEPVAGLLADSLGLQMRNQRFQLAVMNETEPSASEIMAFENDLKNHVVKVVLFNNQTSDVAARRLLQIAHQEGIPVVGVSETEPAGKTYQEWMLQQLDKLDAALKPGAH